MRAGWLAGGLAGWRAGWLAGGLAGWRNKLVGVKPELKCMPACTRIRMKILPHLLKARQSANIFPSNIQLIFDLLYGINTNTKLKAYGIQMIHHMCLNCTDQKFATFSPVLQTKLINLVRESEEDPKVIRLAYVALGKLVHKFPQLVSTNIALVQVFFSVISQVDSETRLAVQEALALMADAFRDLSDLNRAMMEALLTEAIDKDDPQSRMMAVQYCEKIFPRDHVPASYILLLAAGDQKEDIRIEARKALNITGGMDKLTSNKSPVALDTIILPAFPRMVLYIKEKADLRVTSQKRYEGSGHTLPFNPATFSEILVFLRACLARSAGLPPDVDGVADMKEQAPVISKYVSALLKEDSSERSPVQTYVTLAVMLVKAAVGELPMYCLLEMVAMAAELLVPQFIKHLDWLKTLVFSKNDGIRDHAANLYAIVVCSRGDEGCTLDALETMQKSLSNKVLETQHGAMLTLGYMVGQLLRRTRQGDGSRAVSPKILTIMEKAVRDIACMIKGADESSPLLVSGACQSLGEIGRNAPLTLPLGGGDASTEEITKLSVINNLLAIVKSGKENVKSKERAALCLGQLCVGDPGLPYRRMVIEGLMKSVTTRQVDLQIGLGEALVFAAQGPSAPIGRDMWTQTEAEWKERADSDSDEVEWYVTELLAKYVVSTNPHVRQASSVWLLALVKGCSAHPALQGRLLVLQSAFMQLLSENDELTQDISSKGLGLVYDVCSKEQKEALVGELVDTLTTGKRKVQKVSADTQVFEEDSIGKTPDGGNLSTYKELCSIANDLNQPDLIYKFMHLANHHALWNSKKGAAFGFSTIAAQAGEQLAPYLPQIVPRLYRYQFDPNIKIQRAMTSIWNSLVKDNKSTVDTYLKEILEDLLCNLTNAQWRIRESRHVNYGIYMPWHFIL
ncbi:hypothetical protein DPMN_105024 [Dreissena polymorpha]|uniref:Proteasome-associated protein ECM29 homolog n=1 Tax=Dreissena polymorpha TaxID=45954 RepID=A0A9D4K222_DREPO|nr:hypothetical protein DPMN_105024 [Dreissena polymorpha]